MLQANRILRILLLSIAACEPLTLLARQVENDFPEQKRNPRLAPSAVENDNPSLAPSAVEISISGRVTDRNGQAISDADVILVAHRASPYNDSIFPNGLILSNDTTHANGEYTLSIRRSDPRLIGNNFSLYVRSIGFAHKLETIPPSRLLVDYPMDVQLTPAAPFDLQILSDTGEPLKGVRVAPAFIGDKQIPFNVVDQFSEVSDQNGIVTLHSARPSSLVSIYATPTGSIDSCSQCIEVKHNQSMLTSTLLPIRRVRGKLVFEKSESPSSLPKEPIHIGFVSKGELVRNRIWDTFSWCDAVVDKNGNFEIAYWTGGQLDFKGSLPLDFPFVLDREKTQDTILSRSNEIILKLLPAMLVRGKLVDAESDQGLEGVYVDYFDRFSRPAISKSDGSFQLWSQSNQVNVYPTDTFGEIMVVGEAFYQRPESLPQNGVIEMKPTKMRSMTTALGRAVDEQGQPVPGLSIKCQSKISRFETTTTLLSDRNGNFRFFGLTDGTRVSITANSGTRGTETPLRVKLSNAAVVDLVIADLPSAQFAGRVVDLRNNPIVGATVSIKTAITSSPETIGGVDRHVLTDTGDSDEFLTDANGNFLSAPTTLLTDDRTVRVTAPGFVEYRSGWHRPKVTDSKEGLERIMVGTIVMNSAPKQETVTIHIVDLDTQMPINGAKIVTLGARCGQSRLSLSDSSKADMIWVDTPSILAVRAEGYIPSIEAIGSMTESNHTVKLTKDPKHIPQRVPSSDSDNKRVLATEELLALVPEPAEKDNYFKKLNYYPLLGFARPEKLIDKFEAAKLAGASDMILQAYMTLMMQVKLADSKRLLQSFQGNGRASLLIQLAQQSKIESERNEYLAEASIELRQIQGNESIFFSNQLACIMLKLGAVDKAEKLLRTTWDNHKELQDIVKRGERREGRHDKQGVSRYFAPAFAIVDPLAAMKLIELTAYANEIERLQAEAICFMASQGKVGWESQVKRLESMPNSESGVSQFCENVGFRDYERALAVAHAMQPCTGRTKLLMHIAEKCEVTREQRMALYQDTLNALRNPIQSNSYTSMGTLAGLFAQQVGRWDRALAEDFLFEAIWQSSSNNSWLPHSHLCDIATQLAQYDANLAMTLVAPCFEDWSWLFGDMDYAVAYQQAAPFLAMANIDSAKTLEKVKELFSGELADQPSRKLSVVNGIVHRWSELRNNDR